MSTVERSTPIFQPFPQPLVLINKNICTTPTKKQAVWNVGKTTVNKKIICFNKHDLKRSGGFGSSDRHTLSLRFKYKWGSSFVSQQKRVLCVDDNSAICEVVTSLLRSVEVRTAASIASALALAAMLQFDLFILDIQLPDGLGTDLLVSLRRAHPKTPAVFITAMNGFTSDEARSMGALDVIHKSGGTFVRDLVDVAEGILDK